jgi:hypothetical protein
MGKFPVIRIIPAGENDESTINKRKIQAGIPRGLMIA